MVLNICFVLANRISEIEKKEIIDDYIKNETLEEISKKFNFTKSTITRHLKKSLGDEKYREINQISKKKKINSYRQDFEKFSESSLKSNSEKFITYESLQEHTFFEIAPLNYEIESTSRQELSSIPISEINFPDMVYMIVDKNIELEIKYLRDYPQWDFLPNSDLNRKTIEIFNDIKVAKRFCKKEQKVIKVPNTDVFRIVAPILISRGISRIISSEQLIAL